MAPKKTSPGVTMPGSDASADQKLDFLMKMVSEIMVNTAATSERFSALETAVASVDSKVDTIDAAFASYRKETDNKLSAMQDEIVNVKTAANSRDQLLRMKSIKLAGLPISDEESKAADVEKFLGKRVYDKILAPILTAARENDEIETVPTLAKTIEEIRRVKNWNQSSSNTNIPGLHSKPSAPPIIIIKLCSPQIRLAILRYKKLNTPAPSSADRAAGCKGFFISEDITQPTAKLLKELNDDDRVERAWTVEGRIRFIRAGDKDRRIVKVKSVFDSISTILGPSV
jgi:hypothetical protein